MTTTNTKPQNTEGARNDHETKCSDSWTGQDGREWRRETVWCSPGWRTFLAVKVNGKWQGW